MDGNPLLLVFLAIAVVFTIAIVVLAILQRRLLADQSRAVREMLEEARELSQRGELSFDGPDDDEQPRGD
jgi:hypothetical protein